MYAYVLVRTDLYVDKSHTYWYVLVHTGMYWYILVCTSTYHDIQCTYQYIQVYTSTYWYVLVHALTYFVGVMTWYSGVHHQLSHIMKCHDIVQTNIS